MQVRSISAVFPRTRQLTCATVILHIIKWHIWGLMNGYSAIIPPSLLSLFNHSPHSGTVLFDWKSANFTPVHKKEKKKPATNYQPIPLLSIISKVLERCVCNRFYDHALGMINDAQHGFLHGRSCVTQLLTTLHRIGQLLDNAIFLGFAKAFDSVDHNILLTKLSRYGISGNLYSWFSSYLHGRKPRVVVEGIASEWSPCNHWRPSRKPFRSYSLPSVH